MLERRIAPILILVLALVLSASSAGPVFAQTYWLPNTGEWAISENWSNGRPTVIFTAVIDNGGTATLGEFSGGAYWLGIGQINSGHVRIENSQTLYTTITDVGSEQGASGTLTMSNPGSSWRVDVLKVGDQGNGFISISDGARMDSGYRSQGFSLVGNTVLGDELTGKGTVDLRDAGSLWEVRNVALIIGNRGSGRIEVSDGARLESGGTDYFARMEDATLGQELGSQGSVTVTGPDSSWEVKNTDFFIGKRGWGELTISHGGSVTSVSGKIGNNDSGFGEVSITGEGSNWTIAQEIFVGISGNGYLSIKNGGTLNAQAASVGLVGLSEGTAEVTGANSTWNIAESLVLGGISGKATVTIADQGSISAANVVIGIKSRMQVEVGGTLIAPNGLVNTGALHNDGMITGDLGVLGGGIATGSGVFDGTVVINGGGTFSPGSNPGSVSTGETIWSAGGRYLWEINATASGGGSEGDAIGWDLWNMEDLSMDGPFTIALKTLTQEDAHGSLDDWNAFVNQQWRIAIANNAAFSDLSNLSLDTTAFVNPLEGGFFSLSTSADGRELFVQFSAVPEASSVLLGMLGLVILAAAKRRVARTR